MAFSSPKWGYHSGASEGSFPEDGYTYRWAYADGIIYEGRAKPAKSTSAAVWQVKRRNFDANGRPSTILFADGDLKFDNVWDNYASLSYS